MRLSDFSILEYLDNFTWLLRLDQKLRWISQLRSKRNKLPPFGDLFPWWEIFRRAKCNLKSREFVFEPSWVPLPWLVQLRERSKDVIIETTFF